VARQIAANSPFGVGLSKEIRQTNVDASSLEAALALENRSQVLATRTEDMAEALAAFREKRAPHFRNR
jgi:enoyl-CoA hydratase